MGRRGTKVLGTGRVNDKSKLHVVVKRNTMHATVCRNVSLQSTQTLECEHLEL